MPYNTTKSLKKLARSYQEKTRSVEKLSARIENLESLDENVPDSMYESIDKRKEEIAEIKKKASALVGSMSSNALTPLEKLKQQTKANKERSLRAMESSESSDDSDQENSVSQDSHMEDVEDEPPTRRDIAHKHSKTNNTNRDLVPVPPKTVKRKRVEASSDEDEPEVKRPTKKAKKAKADQVEKKVQVEQGDKKRKPKTPRITTNEAFGAAKNIGIRSDAPFRIFSFLYKKGPSQPQYCSSFATTKGPDRYKFVMDDEFRELAANTAHPVPKEVPDAAIVVAQAAGRSICDSTIPIFTVRIASDPSGKNNSGADRAFFSGYVDQTSSSIQDVDLNEKLSQMFPVADSVRDHCRYEMDESELAPYMQYNQEYPGYYPYSQAIEDYLPVLKAYGEVYPKYKFKQTSTVVFPTEELSQREPVTINNAITSAFIRCAVFGGLNGRAIPGTLLNGFVDTLTVHLPTVCKGLFDVDSDYLASALRVALDLSSDEFTLPGLETLMAEHRQSSSSPFPPEKIAAAAFVDDLRDVVNLFKDYQTLVRSYLDSTGKLRVTDSDHFVEYVAPELEAFVLAHPRLQAALEGKTELPPVKASKKSKDPESSIELEPTRVKKVDKERHSFVPPTMRLTPPTEVQQQATDSFPIPSLSDPELLAAYRQCVVQQDPSDSRLEFHPALSSQPVAFSAEGYYYSSEHVAQEELMDISPSNEKPSNVIPGLSIHSTQDTDPEAAELARLSAVASEVEATGFTPADLDDHMLSDPSASPIGDSVTALD